MRRTELKVLNTTKINDTKKFAKEIFGATKILDFRGFRAFLFRRIKIWQK